MLAHQGRKKKRGRGQGTHDPTKMVHDYIISVAEVNTKKKSIKAAFNYTFVFL